MNMMPVRSIAVSTAGVLVSLFLFVTGSDFCEAKNPPPKPVVTALKDYRFEILPLVDITSMKANESKWYQFRIKNTGSQYWPSGAGVDKVLVSYHWMDPPGSKMVVESGVRTPFKRDVKPGESLDYGVQIQAPPMAGKYLLQVTLVHEGHGWFESKGQGKPANYYNVTVSN